jgi:antitoxin component YwqK of YwqJK toxin-antitoxin module
MWYYPNGQLLREETYRNGKEEGIVTEYDSLGNVITKGEYVNGVRNGEWFYHVGDHTEKGKYVEGERDGMWEYYYEDGQLAFTGNYDMGLAVGKHKYFHPNGTLKAYGKYKQGYKEGVWYEYDLRGNVILEKLYKRGVEVRINGAKVQDKFEPLRVNEGI